MRRRTGRRERTRPTLVARLIRGGLFAAAPHLVRAIARSSPGARPAALVDAVVRGRGVVELPERHPLAPAAVRVERSNSWGRLRRSNQTAVTVWFGEGPALPGPGATVGRTALRVGAGLLSAAAVAAAGGAAARLTTPRPAARLAGPADLPRIEPPAA